MNKYYKLPLGRYLKVIKVIDKYSYIIELPSPIMGVQKMHTSVLESTCKKVSEDEMLDVLIGVCISKYEYVQKEIDECEKL